MNETLKKKALGILPYAIGAILVVQFAALGVWQIDPSNGQISLLYELEGIPNSMGEAEGSLDGDHQFLLENIIINSRYGYYVITPLITAPDEPVLLVNRGWVERTAQEFDVGSIDIEAPRITVRGGAGSLPRAGYRMGEAVTPGASWPMRAVYPTLNELSQALGRPVQPFVLLMDPQDEAGFYRHWVPEEMGPGRHFAYALQWFAMSIVLAALLVWNYRKRGLET